MGLHQAQTYRAILETEFVDVNGKPAMGAKLQKLRQAATCPHSSNLDGFQSRFDFTPKVAATLQLIENTVTKGEQVAVFNAFTATTDTVSRRLRLMSIPHLICDGRENYDARGAMALQFRNGGVPVLLAGESSMGYGHDFPNLSNIILPSQDWAMDLREQAISRGHRLAGTKDVNLYALICRGSIDEPIEDLLNEKAATALRVLDADDTDDEVTETDRVKLLESAKSFFGRRCEIVDEQQLADNARRWNR
jgi:SNF2 family DNA or RNA helicase